jgi:hypothetical protein
VRLFSLAMHWLKIMMTRSWKAATCELYHSGTCVSHRSLLCEMLCRWWGRSALVCLVTIEERDLHLNVETRAIVLRLAVPDLWSPGRLLFCHRNHKPQTSQFVAINIHQGLETRIIPYMQLTLNSRERILQCFCL